MLQPDLSVQSIGPRGVQRSIGVLQSVRTNAGAPAATPQAPSLEREALDRLLALARDGVGGALVLRGKSATGATVSASEAGEADGMRVLRAAGVKSEAGLPYAALHQLLMPFLSHLDRLPGPQGPALRAAFGLVEAPPPGLFFAAMAVLTLVSGLADEEPLLLALDDGQWLDQATAQVLAFVGRRLRNCAVALVVAVREPYAGPRALRGLPEVSPTGPVAHQGPPELQRRASRTSAALLSREATADTRLWKLADGGPPWQTHPAQTRLLDAVYRGLVAGRLAPSGLMDETIRTARAWLMSLNRPTAAGDLLLDGYVIRLTTGHPPAVPAFRAALAQLLGDEAGMRHSAGTLGLACWAAGELLDTRTHDAVARRWAEAAAAAGQGEPGRLPIASSLLHQRGLAAGAELLELAWRGDEQDARIAAQEQVHSGIERKCGLAVTMAQYASTILELGLGHYDAALASALTVYEDDPPDLGTQILPDLVEAAARAGNSPIAQSALDRFAARARADDTPLARGLLARSRALTAADDAAEDMFREAVEELLRSNSDLQLARTRLLYGEWLRRRRRRRDARVQLTTAWDTFGLAGARAFARRARVEADATGERVSRRTHPALDQQLTSQEAAVTRLVIKGSSNRDVAAQLFISINTVEYHLRKVFRKVGVSSRTQLTRTLLDGGRCAPVLMRGAET